MNSKIETINPMSANNERHYMWVSEYLDGNIQTEFEGNKHNKFTDIEKQELLNFGMVGLGNRVYYEVGTGKFKINGSEIEIVYRTDDWQYNLTNQMVLYNDVIQYKDCFATLNAMQDTGSSASNIASYNFGYKVKFDSNNKEFNFKAVVKLPLNQQPHINLRLVCNEDMNGVLLIKQDGIVINQFKAPLRKGFGGEINWMIK